VPDSAGVGSTPVAQLILTRAQSSCLLERNYEWSVSCFVRLDFLCLPLWNPPRSSAVDLMFGTINRKEESEVFAEVAENNLN